MNAVSRFSQGIDKDTFKGVGYLLWLNIKKQIVLWVFITIVLLLCTLTIIGQLSYYKNSSYSKLWQVKLYVQNSIIAGTLIPILFISIFSIPSTLNTIHKSTLIKRIGSTRLNEQSFTMLLFIWYFIISFALLTIFYLGITIITFIFGSGINLLDKWLITYLFSIFVVIMLVCIGILLGTLPISQAFVTAIAVVLFIVSILFGGFLLPLTNEITSEIPVIGKGLLIVNPLGFSSFAMASLLTGTYGSVNTILSLVYVLAISILFFLSSSILMNFNKIN